MAEPNTLISGFEPENTGAVAPMATPGAGSEGSWLSRLLSGVKEFAGSDMGRGMSGALGVGLLGLHPNPELQSAAMKMVMQQAAEREKQRTLGAHASAVAQLHAGIMDDIAAGRDASAMTRIKTATSNPAMAAALGPSLGPIIAAGTSIAERMRKSRAYQAGITAVGGMDKITSSEAVQVFMKAWTDAGGDSTAGHAVLKLEAPFAKESKGQFHMAGDVPGEFVPGTAGKPGTFNPLQIPEGMDLTKREKLTVAGLDQETKDVLARSDYEPLDIVNRVNRGEAGAGFILKRARDLAAALRESGKAKKSYDDADSLTFTLSGGRYQTQEDAMRAGDVKLMGEVQKALEGTKTRIQAGGEREKLHFLMNEMPAAMQEGYRGKIIVDRKTLKEDLSVSPAKLMGKERTHTVLSEQDSKLWSGMNVMERSIPLLEELVPRLAKTSQGVLSQKFDSVLSSYFGVPTVAGVVNTLEALKLRMAATFQGANAQLSDKDVAAVAGLSLNTWDSESTAKLKIAGLKAMARIIKASLADSETAAAQAITEYRATLDKIVGSSAGVPGMKIPPRR